MKSKQGSIGPKRYFVTFGIAFVMAAIASVRSAVAGDDGAQITQFLPTGQRITPQAAAGAIFQDLDPKLPLYPDHRAGQAVTVLASHDGKTLAILTSGFNLVSDSTGKKDDTASNEYVFVYDISSRTPRQVQVLHVPNTDAGMEFSGDDSRLYVSGGVDDDLHTYTRANGVWSEDGGPVALGHKAGLGLGIRPSAAGVAVSSDGRKIIIANRHNDSITIVDARTRRVTAELDLRPGKNAPAQIGVAGGEYPDWVCIRGNDTAYVSSQRDREIVAVDISRPVPRIAARIKVQGTPSRMILNADQSVLYVAADNSDSVTAIDTVTNAIRETIDLATAPATFANAGHFRGAAPNSLALSPDGNTLYATDGGTNALAIVPLAGPAPHRVAAFVPTGWYPNGVAATGDMLYVVNGRSDPGPNPAGCAHASIDPHKRVECIAGNRYILQLSKAGFLSFPVPAVRDYRALTDTVAVNNGFSAKPDPGDTRLMRSLRHRIKHVIYIVKENRTYDQVLGDLDRGNGDARLALFGAQITPNEHALAVHFVTLDNFYDAGEVSGNGWPWSTEARETDVGVKAIPMQYADRGQSYDVEGTDRNINVALPTLALRRAANDATPDDPDQLPGTADVGAPDAPDGEQGRGHLWDAALRAHLSVRNYGFFCDAERYSEKHPHPLPVDRNPAASKTTVAYASDPALVNLTDPYFRSFDLKLPDFYREREWEREFAQYVAHKNLPNLSLVRFMTDHTGDFANAIDRVNTPEAQVADNDYAVGRLVEAVAKSPYRNSTLIFVIEDDAQDGPDHVDAHRSIAFVAGPYVKQGAVVSTHYSTVNMLRTIEDVLGIQPLSLNDAYQRPMTDVFDLRQKKWSFSAEPSPALAATDLPIPKKAARAARAAHFAFAHDARYWAGKTRGYDWSREDKVDAASYNRVLWAGLAGSKPYPR
jgi:YVTN family beta-propeller protein